MTVFYVDVSHHDRNRRGRALDWEQIFGHTAKVMVARGTYGDPNGYNPPSPFHTESHTNAKAAGARSRGTYHNLINGDAASTSRQVDYLRRTMDGVGAQWGMLDVERYTELVNNGLWPRWSDVQRFCARWRAVESRRLVAYIPGWLYNGYYAGQDIKALGVALVESDYGSNPGGLPAAAYNVRGGDGGRGWDATGGLAPTVWQFSSQGDLPGASGNTDYNAFRGTEDQLVAFLNGGGGVEVPTQAEWDAVEAKVNALHTELLSPDKGINKRHVVQLVKDLAYVFILGPTGSTAWVGTTLTRIAAEAGIDQAELDQVAAAARAGAESAASVVAEKVAAVVKETAGDALSEADLARVEAKVREAFEGGLVLRPEAE